MRKSVPISSVLVFYSSGVLLGYQAGSQKPPQVSESKEQVVVTGSWVPVPLEESDRAVRTYPLRTPSLLFANAVDALALDSSVQVQSRAPNGIQGDVSIRGGSFDQTLFLLNGIRLSDAQSAHHNLDLPVPIDAINRIELLRGSGSTLYGSDAIAGVVNVVTAPATDELPFEMRLRAGYGSFGTNEQSGFVSLKNARLSQRFSFEREFSTGFRPDRDYRNLAIASESWIRTRLGLTRVFLSLLDRPFGADQFYGNYPSWERTKTWLATYSQDLGPRTLITLGFRRHTDLYVLLRNNPAYYTNRHADESWDVAVRRNDRLSNLLHLYYGAEAIADNVHSTNLGMHSRKRGALYGDLDVRSWHRFSFNIGTRQEFYGHGQTIAVPSVTGGYWASSKIKLRASVTRAFRLPNYTDLYYHDPANIGNSNLKPERAVNYEGGIDLHATEHWRGSLTVFSRHETDNIDYVRANPQEVWQATNFGQLTFTGLEGALTWNNKGQTADLQYTALHGAESALGPLQSKYVFNYPTQQVTVGWQRITPRGLQMRLRVGGTDQRQRPAYVLVDAYAAYTRSRFHPYVRLTNLTNTSYQPVYGVLMPGRAVFAGLELCVVCRNR